jgi:hypothetical protein
MSLLLQCLGYYLLISTFATVLYIVIFHKRERPMQGTMLIIRPGANVVEEHKLNAAPRMHEMQRVVGGWLEHVPSFGSITHDGRICPCVCLVNEEGKFSYSTFPGQTGRREPLEANGYATSLWLAAQEHHPLPVAPDVLCGPVLILIGDREFMQSI